jgi:DNA-binding MarR family transcriptional regulator
MNSEMENLLNEVRLVYHRIVEVAEQLHRSEAVTLGMRAVLEYLLKSGPTTVPDIARARFVTRQHIQKLVNALLEEDLVRLEKNPLHRRSSLVALTEQGERVVLRMRRREAAYFEKTEIDVTQEKIRAAVDTLRSVRESLRTPET